jgi:hypothetical protein
MKGLGVAALVVIAVTVCSLWVAADAGQGTQPAAAPEATLTDIPGITTPDKTPNACVDCHANHPERNRDSRLPAVLARWQNSVPSEVLEKAKASTPRGKTLVGKHPDVSMEVRTIPNDCLNCHKRDSREAPPFAKLLHAIHLVSGKENHFLAGGRGNCTSCHKLDQKTGAWRLGSGDAK